MIRALLPAFVVACSTPSAPVAPGPLPLSPLPVAAPAPAVAFVDDVIVVEVSGITTNGDAPIRAMRRIVAARQGQVAVTSGFGAVSFVVTKVVSGKLFDPDYAQRPEGVNELPIVLVDEAAYMAPYMRSHFAGTWHLTQLADGTLVAGAIEDTPWEPSTVDGRRAVIAGIRADLRDPTIVRRAVGLAALQTHQPFEVIPDVIALLDDQRRLPKDERIIAEVADATLDTFARFVGGASAPDGRSMEEWQQFWAERFTQVDPLPAIAQSTATEHVRLFMRERWPEFKVSDSGIVVGVTRLFHKFDGNESGIFVNDSAQRTWIAREAVDGLEVAGKGIVWDSNSRWHFATTTGKAVELAPEITKSERVAIATTRDGFFVLGVDKTKHLHALELDADGKQRRKAKLVLPASAGTRAWHVRVASRADGWLAVVTTDHGLFAVSIDGALRLRSVTPLFAGGVEAKIAAGNQRALAAWDLGTQIQVVVTDLDGKPVDQATVIGNATWDLSAPIALDDGFAIAWIEAGRELHVGRFDRTGALTSNVVVQARHVAAFTGLHLARDRDALVVTFLDTTRYPYAIVTRRL